MASNASMLAFRICVALLALIPVSAGAAGVIFGLAFPGFGMAETSASAESHFMFLSGVFMAVGVSFWSCIWQADIQFERFKLLAKLVVVGGLARLFALVLHGTPGLGHVLGLVMELGVVPALYIWSTQLSGVQKRF